MIMAAAAAAAGTTRILRRRIAANARARRAEPIRVMRAFRAWCHDAVLITVAPSFRWCLRRGFAVGCLLRRPVGAKRASRSPDECVDLIGSNSAITVRVAHTEMGRASHARPESGGGGVGVDPVRYKVEPGR